MFTPKALSSSRARTPQFTPSKGYTPGRNTNTSFSQQTKSHTASRNQSFNKSFQTSNFLDETTLRLDTYGGALPVAVTEALAFSDRSTPPTIKLDSSGWAKLVVGRKLLIWKYKPSAFAKVATCIELILPTSSQKQNADLVALYYPRQDSAPACIATSPEGIIRHWSCVTHEATYCDVTADIKGDLCQTIIAIEVDDQEYQCIIATESSSLVIVTPLSGQNAVKCHTVKSAEGALSGIGRRMSSFIFGGAPAKPMFSKCHALVGGEMLPDGASFYMLSGSNLQKWVIFDDAEKMLYDHNIEQQMGDSISRQIWKQDAAQLPKLKVWLLDMQPTNHSFALWNVDHVLKTKRGHLLLLMEQGVWYNFRDAVVILGAAYNPDVADQVYYALGTLHTEGQDPPRSFLSFAISQYTATYEVEETALKMRMLIPDSSSSNAYLHEPKAVIITSVATEAGTPDKIEFNSPGDKLLGSGFCDNTALFFSNTHGLVAVKDSAQEQAANVSIRDQSMAVDVSMRIDEHPSLMMSPGKIEEMSLSDDSMQRLKSAFLQFLRSNTHDAQMTVENLFPSAHQHASAPGSLLNTLVSGLSEEMINDIPAQDPRWAEAVPQEAGGSTSSLILIHQLEDKLRAHDLFIKFLHTMALWDRLSTVRVRGSDIPTGMLLCEHAEKLVAAKQLRELHMQHTAVVDAVVKMVLESRGVTSLPSGLTHNDIFYREVSKIDEILEHFVEFEQEFLSITRPSKEVTGMIETITSIIYGMLYEAHQHRESKQLSFRSSTELLPWTSALRDTLSNQHKIISEQAINEAQDGQERGQFFQQLFELSDMILDGYRVQLDSIKQHLGETERYNDVRTRYIACRTELLLPFMEHEQFERAAALAEKYCDFQVLVTICEQTENQDRLQRYMNQFQNMGFSDFVFRWYVEQGKRGKLMASSLASHPQLSGFLQTTDNKFMSWLHDINAGDFYRAHDTLQQLSRQEEQFLSRKKTLLSLSKLAALATDDPPSESIDSINYELDIILHQEQLPQDVVENMAMDADTMPVMSTQQLIELYVSDYNANANEFDFKKALDLLHYVEQHDLNIDRQQLLVHIWSKAILRDDWSLIPTDDPLENNKHTIFYKTLELAHADEGLNLKDQLPSPDALLGSDELAMICLDKNVQFLLRAQLEHYHRILV